MNTYTYEELELGQRESFTVTVTEAMLDAFCAMSGDVNPLHCDGDYARSRGYPGRVVYGMLTASFYSTLAGVYLPGKNALLYAVDSRFRKSVFVGDTLTISGTVAEKNDTFRLLKLKAEIKNAQGEKVSKATLEVGFTSP